MPKEEERLRKINTNLTAEIQQLKKKIDTKIKENKE